GPAALGWSRDAEWRRRQTAEGGCPTVQLDNYRFWRSKPIGNRRTRSTSRLAAPRAPLEFGKVEWLQGNHLRQSGFDDLRACQVATRLHPADHVGLRHAEQLR